MTVIVGGQVTWHVEDSQWKAGCALLPVACAEVATNQLRESVDEGFEKSQEVVHVVTSRLKDSGHVEEGGSLMQHEFTVVYGGGEVDYAEYEELYHPFLEPSMLEAMRGYETKDGDYLDSMGFGL